MSREARLVVTGEIIMNMIGFYSLTGWSASVSQSVSSGLLHHQSLQIVLPTNHIKEECDIQPALILKRFLKRSNKLHCCQGVRSKDSA